MPPLTMPLTHPMQHSPPACQVSAPALHGLSPRPQDLQRCPDPLLLPNLACLLPVTVTGLCSPCTISSACAPTCHRCQTLMSSTPHSPVLVLKQTLQTIHWLPAHTHSHPQLGILTIPHHSTAINSHLWAQMGSAHAPIQAQMGNLRTTHLEGTSNRPL